MGLGGEYALEDVVLVLLVVSRIYCTQFYARPSFSEDDGVVLSDINGTVLGYLTSLSFRSLHPRVRMEVPHVAPLPVAQLNDEQGLAEVERALASAAKRNQRFNLVWMKMTTVQVMQVQ